MRTITPAFYLPMAGRRRRAPLLLAAIAGVLCSALLLGGPARAWHSTDLSGAFPPLDFTMTRASDGKTVTAADFKGKVVLLYFGYTFCPDVCPTTLLNISEMLKTLRAKADQVRVLFVTVDPNRDTLPVLKEYTSAFAPQVEGLRGTADELAALAKRYRVSYSVEPAEPGHPYEVTHSAVVYVFDRDGSPRLLFSSLSQPDVKTAPMADDLQTLIAQSGGGWWDRLLSFL
jgi:protein SCO1